MRTQAERTTGTRRHEQEDRADLPGLLHLQRTVGNRAVAAMVQRSATSDLETIEATAKPTDTYELGIDALTDDIVGHAWIDITEKKAGGKYKSIGFWPTVLAVNPFGWTGQLRSPDSHDGEAMHRQSEVINHDRFLKVLSTVKSWEGSYYQILYHNCAHFARAAWLAGTAHPDGIINESGPAIWTPGEQGDVIDRANKARGLDPKGQPLKTADASDGGGGDQQLAGNDLSASEGTDADSDVEVDVVAEANADASQSEDAETFFDDDSALA